MASWHRKDGKGEEQESMVNWSIGRRGEEQESIAHMISGSLVDRGGE
jgi:hypothetical protein